MTIAGHDFSAAFWALDPPEAETKSDAQLVLPAWVEQLGVQQNAEAEAHLGPDKLGVAEAPDLKADPNRPEMFEMSLNMIHYDRRICTDHIHV